MTGKQPQYDFPNVIDRSGGFQNSPALREEQSLLEYYRLCDYNQ